jgi:hypothetical protein
MKGIFGERKHLAENRKIENKLWKVTLWKVTSENTKI